MSCWPAWSAGSPAGSRGTGGLGSGRDGPPGGGGGRAPLTAALALPVLRSGTAPDAVGQVVGPRELKAFLPHPAPGTDRLGSGDLPLSRTLRRYREEEVWVGRQARAGRPPVGGAPSRGHQVSSRGSELVLYAKLRWLRPFCFPVAHRLHLCVQWAIRM